MLSYRFMYMSMNGSRNGTGSVPDADVVNPSRYGFLVTPTKMPMMMHMVGGMYAPADQVTFTVMLPILSNSMDHLTRAGGTFTTNSSGIGDLKIGALVGLGAFGNQTVHANLAVSIAQGINHYVLLVDCDLRRPTLHKTFGLQVKDGLREYLEEGTSIAPYLVKTPVSKLTLLPAGNPIASPSELLSSEKMHLLTQEIRDRYQDRFIIFDTPPAHFIADTAFLADVLDGVVLVVHAGRSHGEIVKDVVASIGKENILGVVFNATEEAEREYGFYYRYYKKKA